MGKAVDLDVVLHVITGYRIDIGGKVVPVLLFCEIERTAAADVTQRLAAGTNQDRLAAADDFRCVASGIHLKAYDMGKTVALAIAACIATFIHCLGRIDNIEGVEVGVVACKIGMERNIHQATVTGSIDLVANIQKYRAVAGIHIDQIDAATLFDYERLIAGARKPFDVERLGKAGHHWLDRYVEIGLQRRIDRICDRIFVVENIDIGCSGKQKCAACNVDQRHIEALGRLARCVIENRYG